ncbi:MAG: hypothetical protein HY883_05720, partial [Deltaproteobacteria bacterium]|nr:hypothetical protein [Deltaproteobacteria bacterium]
PGLDGTYNANLSYAFEGGDTWCNDNPPGNGCNNEIVLYCKDFGFTGTAVPRSCTAGVPVYRIDSEGTTSAAGTVADVRAFIAASTLNVVPPAGEIFSNSSLDAGGSTTLAANVCADPADGGTSGCSGSCTNACSATYPGEAVMNSYLGVDLSDLKSYADPPSPYNQVGATVVYDTTDWGNPCSTNATTDPAPHICGNDSKVIYIDNPGKTAKITSNGAGRGILIVTGDLDVSGTFLWEGMIYVMGNLGGTGTIDIYGTIMAQDTIDFNGNVTGVGSLDVAAGVAQTIGMPKVLRWVRR